MKHPALLAAALSALTLLFGCATAPPEGIEPVRGFDPERYLGKWYEIARLDHRFERGLSNVTAVYAERDDGGIDVLNQGYDRAVGQWKTAGGKAYFLKDRNVASLKVSFFGPFYGGYHVIALDREDYGHALVCGPSRSYLWILARTPSPPRETVDQLTSIAKDLGFPVQDLIFVAHDRTPPS